MLQGMDLYAKANQAGVDAGNCFNPNPMIVAGGSKSYYVSEGMCGFAWVRIKPARGKFVSWLKKNGIGRSDSYGGGYVIWISGFGQSYERKLACAEAMAKVMEENGINAYAESRLD